jgi:hypothetical protein
MTTTTYAISPGLISEHVGQDVLVLLPGARESLCLTGEAAKAFLAIEAGLDPAPFGQEALDGLVGRGVISHGNSRGISRRALVGGGVVGLGAGAIALSLPTVAAAVSGVPVSGIYATANDGGNPPQQGVALQVLGFDFPDDFGFGGPESPNRPSDLTVTGFGTPVPLSLFDATGDLHPPEKIEWFLPEDPPPAPFAGYTATLTGRFTWAGTTYVATFTPIQL